MPDNDNKSITRWLPIVGLAWLIPGGGHFLLGHRFRGLILAGTTVLLFCAGLAMRGAMFEPQRGDLFTTLIYYGGFVADLASGVLYMLAVSLGYNQAEMAGHVHDYGTKFIVGAGLFNILAMVDAYELATGKKT
jgi:hypothetical protein